MASLKDIKRHIGAVKQTQKLTKAMNMVAAAKLRATQGRTERCRQYALEHARLMDEIGRRCADVAPDLALPNEGKKSLMLVFTSDRGLCGSYNANIFGFLLGELEAVRARGLTPELYLFGRKGSDYYHRYRSSKIYRSVVGESALFDYDRAREVTDEIIALFKGGDYAEIAVCYTSFKTLTRHVVTVDALLPLAHGTAGHHGAKAAATGPDAAGPPAPSGPLQDYDIEPRPRDLLNRLIPRSLTIMVYQALLESVTSENAARMQAMDNASKSCKDIVESLTRAYNKARQASVTSELLDIVNGAEALRG